MRSDTPNNSGVMFVQQKIGTTGRGRDAKKPTHPNNGGWRGKQASRDALAHHRFNVRDAPKCAKCGRPKTKGSRFCYYHGGAAYSATKPSPRRIAGRQAQMIVRRAQRDGILPDALLLTPIWRDTARTMLAMHRPALMAAWIAQDVAGWLRALKIAEDDIACHPVHKYWIKRNAERY